MNFLFKNFFVLAVVTLGTAFAQDSKPANEPAQPSPVPTTVGAASAKQPADLDSLDFNDATDVYFTPGTQTPHEGPVTSKYENGAVALVGALKAGKRDGHWIEYYENGQKSGEGEYRDGIEVGSWKYWFENGQLGSEGAFSGGKYVGLWRNFYESGKPSSTGVFVAGKRDGIWKFYDESTGKETTKKFRDDLQIP